MRLEKRTKQIPINDDYIVVSKEEYDFFKRLLEEVRGDQLGYHFAGRLVLAINGVTIGTLEVQPDANVKNE